MAAHDSLGNRMKLYESADSSILTPRTPAILRIDGRGFHNYTRGFDYPFDKWLSAAMRRTAEALMSDCSTAVMAYGQSDEISILLIDYRKHTTQQHFGGKIQKIVSTAASLATAKFNEEISEHVRALALSVFDFNSQPFEDKDKEWVTDRLYAKLINKIYRANFDARVFSLPEVDVPNYFLWRWQDCIRNSVSMAARAQFSHRELKGVGVPAMKDMLRYQADKPWEDMPTHFKDGWVITRPTVSDSVDVTGDIRDLVRNTIKEYMKPEPNE